MKEIKETENTFRPSPVERFMLLILMLLAAVGIASSADAYFMKNTFGIAGFLGIAFLFFSAAVFLFAFQRFRFAEIFVNEKGLRIRGNDGLEGWIYGRNIKELNIRKTRRRWALSAFLTNGGYIDIQTFASRSTCEKRLGSIRSRFSANADNLKYEFSSAVGLNDQNIISWYDGYTPLFRMGLALLFSGVILMTGASFVRNYSVFYVVPLLGILPWIYFGRLLLRDRNRKTAVLVKEGSIVYGYLETKAFHAVQNIPTENLINITYSFDLTAPVQHLYAEFEDGILRMSVPGLSICDGHRLAEYLSEKSIGTNSAVSE